MGEKMEDKIIEILNRIRPYLNSDGGDIEFINYENGCVYIKLLGGCAHCMHINETIKEFILKTLQQELDNVTDVVNVDIW